MRNRLWIIILLIVWVSQWAAGLASPLPTSDALWWEGALLVENLADVVIYQANQQWPCPSRSHSRPPRLSK